MNEKPTALTISDSYPAEYVEHVKSVASDLREQIPFTGRPDMLIIGGSGLLGIAEQITFKGKPVEIDESSIGLPSGTTVEGHSPVMIAGTTVNDKKVVVRSRMVHPYNVPPLGVDTPIGRLSQTDIATMYLHVFSEIGGAGELILSCASGGIANPVRVGDPILFPTIPEITIIGGDMNMAYPSALQGPYLGLGDGVRFPPLRESDLHMKQKYQARWKKVHGKQAMLEEYAYLTSPSSSGYENTTQIRFALMNQFRLVGMSYSAEMERLSTLRRAFPNVLGLGVVTNPLLLLHKDGNDAMMALRKEWGVALSPFDERRLEQGLTLVPSMEEIFYIPPTQLYVDFPAAHEDVKKAGGVAVGMLGPVLVDAING